MASQNAQGKLEPLADGVLTLSNLRLMCNSRSQTIIELAMNADDQASLHDAYKLFHKESAVEQTGYIMQFFVEGFDILIQYSWTLLCQFGNF